MKFLKLVRWTAVGAIFWNALMGSIVKANFVDRELLERGKPFLEMVSLPVINRIPRIDCRVDHHNILENLIMDNDRIFIAVGDRLGDYRFHTDFFRGWWWNFGVDPDYPEPLEIWGCSLYEMLRRHLDGENVRVMTYFADLDTRLTVTEVMGYLTIIDAKIVPFEQLTIVYYLVNGEREYYLNEQGHLVFPYYAWYESTRLKPVHLLELEMEKPDTTFEQIRITLAEFFQLMRNQPHDISHEIWESSILPEDNLDRKPNYLSVKTAPQFQRFRNQGF